MATSRVVITEIGYHQAEGESPTSVETKFARSLKSEEQPYQRRQKGPTEWTPFDFGWVPQPSMFFISNDEGKSIQQIPTAEQQAELATKRLQLAVEVAVLLDEGTMHERTVAGIQQILELMPTEGIRIPVLAGTKWYVRGANVKYTLTAIPE